MHVQYEMFVDKGGKKISKSAGNVFTPQVWYRYGSPQSLNLLIFKRFVGTKSGSVDNISPHMDELDDLEDIYFGKTKILDEVEKARLAGMYEYSWMLKPPEEPRVHVPYNLMIKLARLAPKGSVEEFIRSKLKEYGYLDKGEMGLETRISYALNWVADFAEEAAPQAVLTANQKEAVKATIAALDKASTVEEYQSVVFNVSKEMGLKPRELFSVIYQILLGRNQGPRLGPYIALIGKENVLKELEAVLRNG
jgi:lysyl-tRNA synthetase class 1